MFSSIGNIFSLGRAGMVLARSSLIGDDVLEQLPPAARLAVKFLRIGSASARTRDLSATLQALGPSHIKLGQFLATRPDIIGDETAQQLSKLQDKLPPFPTREALEEIERGLGRPVKDLFEHVAEPVAAASIAQVHKARTADRDGGGRDVAIKVLRPGIEKRFARDLAGFRLVAAMAERLSKQARRLRPCAGVETLAQSVSIEMDLRLEAAAMSELARNTQRDKGFKVPDVDWARTSRRILTLGWVDGISVSEVEQLKQAGHDLPKLAANVIQSFLRQAMRDGFFHADMHPGNLFVNEAGDLVAVDFGIMGRLEPKDRLFLAEILHGFITRDYQRVADVHFNAGYVPASQSPELFAQALCAIGEPIMGKQADDISMARLLAQLFQVTERFDMQTQPQLLLLQKTMVVVEGVARALDPNVNMWTVAEPVVKDWLTTKLGPEGRILDAAQGAATVGRLLADFPATLVKFERMAASLEQQGGVDRGVGVRDRGALQQNAALWIIAAALCVIAIVMLL